MVGPASGAGIAAFRGRRHSCDFPFTAGAIRRGCKPLAWSDCAHCPQGSLNRRQAEWGSIPFHAFRHPGRSAFAERECGSNCRVAKRAAGQPSSAIFRHPCRLATIRQDAGPVGMAETGRGGSGQQQRSKRAHPRLSANPARAGIRIEWNPCHSTRAVHLPCDEKRSGRNAVRDFEKIRKQPAASLVSRIAVPSTGTLS